MKNRLPNGVKTNVKTTFLFAFLLLAAVFAAPFAVQADVAVYQKTLKSTAWVLAKTSDGTSSGTGVLVDSERKLLVTNFHVVGDARAVVIFFPELKEGKPVATRQNYLTNVKRLGVRGQVVAVDRKRDLALVQLSKIPADAQAITLAPSGIGPGENVQSIGNPGSTDVLWVYTSGTVRAVYSKKFRTGAGEHDFKVVETQHPINSGDSGGPVVDDEGRLVAISQAISSKARLVSYCVDISEVKAFMASPWRPAPLPIANVLEQAELKFEAHETGHLEVKIESKDKSETSVFVTKDVEYYERADVRKIWSLAMSTSKPISLETTMKLLEQSAQSKLGAWTIERTPAGEQMVIYVVKLDATSTPATVKSTIEYVAKLTDVMKKELQPKSDTETETASDLLDSWLTN